MAAEVYERQITRMYLHFCKMTAVIISSHVICAAPIGQKPQLAELMARHR